MNTTAIRNSLSPASRPLRHLRLVGADTRTIDRAVSRARDERRRLERTRPDGRFDYLRRGHD
jgi:hypothetical protein